MPFDSNMSDGLTHSQLILQQILDTQKEAKETGKDVLKKVDGIAEDIRSVSKRVDALEFDKIERDRGRSAREKWTLGLASISIASAVGLGGWLLGVASLAYQVNEFGTKYGRGVEERQNSRFERYGDRDNAMDQRIRDQDTEIKNLKTVINDMQSRIK